MPRKKDLKRLVRQRMSKTGEAYTAARRSFLGSVDHPSCNDADCAAMKYALRSLGIVNPHTAKEFSESELFGIGGGIGFAYFVFEYPGFTSLYTGCRINPFVLKTEFIDSHLYRTESSTRGARHQERKNGRKISSAESRLGQVDDRNRRSNRSSSSPPGLGARRNDASQRRRGNRWRWGKADRAQP
jgi:hypothetical protein